MKLTLASLSLVMASFSVLVLAPVALATEAAPEPLAVTAEAATAVPLVLGAPPAWTVMALGATVVALTVMRRMRKMAPARARR